MRNHLHWACDFRWSSIVANFDRGRTHQAIGQLIPIGRSSAGAGWHESGTERTVELQTTARAKALLEKLESQLEAMQETNQMLQLPLQNAMNQQQQAMQILSNIMKSQHDTLKAIIQKLK